MEYLEILELIGRKDKNGLTALYTCYGQKFYYIAVKRWLLNEDDAWEVVYQTLETLVLKLPAYNFESKTHFENFLFKVFTNFLRQFFRKHRKHQFDQLQIDFNFNSSDDSDSDEMKDLEEGATLVEIDTQSFKDYYKTDGPVSPLLLALEKALDQLDSLERDILLLRAQNYSYAEIASMLSIEDKNLKVKYHRSKLKLIQLINNYNQKSHDNTKYNQRT